MTGTSKFMLGSAAVALLAACAAASSQPADGAALPSNPSASPVALEEFECVPHHAMQDRIVVTGSRLAEFRPSAPARVAPAYPSPQSAAPAAPPPASMGLVGPLPPERQRVWQDRDEYRDFDANPIQAVAEDPVSTFSIDVDTASYAVVRRHLRDCHLPPSDAVRVEEIVNYFDYTYPLPHSSDAPFAASVTVTDTPWNADTQLMHIGIQGFDVAPEERPRANLVFLMDVSGSMRGADRLPLAIESLRLLLEQLDEDDTVAIVVYASAVGVVLEPTPASDRDAIEAALGRLQAGGSTAGGAGLELAYRLAEQNLDEDAVNRIILATDGDFNVGTTRDQTLEDFIARKRETGIYLSIMGFGRGNYNDALMQTLAQAGNGTAGYIDTLAEARRMLVEESSSTLFPIANDVKIQVEFNPARVAEYRLIGYESRMLERADFNNDAVDAGEIGSGHAVTAIYEITAPESEARQIDPLRYQDEVAPDRNSGEFAFLRIRYKQPGEEESQLIETPIGEDHVTAFSAASDDVRLSVAAAGYAQLLRQDPHLSDFGYHQVIEIAHGTLGNDPYGYRAEFVELAQRAAALSRGPDGLSQ